MLQGIVVQPVQFLHSFAQEVSEYPLLLVAVKSAQNSEAVIAGKSEVDNYLDYSYKSFH